MLIARLESLDEWEEIAWPEIPQAQHGDQSHSPGGFSEERKDFDDSADELWSLYGNVAQRHDEARIKALKDDMDGIPIYVCTYFPA